MERSGTVDKAVRVLEALSRSDEPTALAVLSARTKLPKPTLHRLLASLSDHELVEQDRDGRYQLGVGLVRLGLGAQAADPFVRAARVELERAVRSFGETFFLVAARRGRLIVLDKVEGTGVLRVAPTIGAEVPVDVTASGRLYLGLAADELPDTAAARRVPKRTIERAVERGYDLNEGEWIDGMFVVAAPVLVGPRMFGTVACAGPASLMGAERREEAIQRTRKLADRIARALGARSERTSPRERLLEEDA